MTSIRKEILVKAPPAKVWAAVRDAGEVHRRLTPGFVTDARLDGDARVVTFADGRMVRELIVAVDEEARRFAYAAVGGRAAYHHASMQVFDAGDGASRLEWITDVLPDDIAGAIAPMVEQGAAVMKKTLEE